MKARSAERIALVGFMGSGKTTVGQLLAESLGCQFIDLDDEIVRHERRTVADIFQAHGEDYFRELESATLRRLIQTTSAPFVLAAGGGAYVDLANAQLLRRSGVLTVFLDAGVDELRQRCAAAGDQRRPLFRDPNLFRQLYEARRGSYMAADLRVDTAGKNPEQVVNEIMTLRARS